MNNTCVKHNFKSVHVSNLFWSREYNSAKEICKYPSFSKVEGNYPFDLKIIWSSAGCRTFKIESIRSHNMSNGHTKTITRMMTITVTATVNNHSDNLIWSHCSLNKSGVQISGHPVAHGYQNVTWATWKRRKIAQPAIKNSSSPISLNYHLSICIVIVFSVTCSTEMLLTERNISYGFSNREPEGVVYRIILRLRSTLNFGKFQSSKHTSAVVKLTEGFEKRRVFFIFCN